MSHVSQPDIYSLENSLESKEYIHPNIVIDLYILDPYVKEYAY